MKSEKERRDKAERKLQKQRNGLARAFSRHFKEIRRDGGDERMVWGILDAEIRCSGRVNTAPTKSKNIFLSLKTFFNLSCVDVVYVMVMEESEPPAAVGWNEVECREVRVQPTFWHEVN